MTDTLAPGGGRYERPDRKGNPMRWRSLSCALLVAGAMLAATPAKAATVVDNCSTYSGSGSLDEALATGGDIIFACDGVIALPHAATIEVATSIDAAGHDVTLDGEQSHSIFMVNNTSFAITGLRLTGARGSAIRVGTGRLSITGSRFDANSASPRSDSVDGVLAAVTGATPAGGAIRAEDSIVSIIGSTFSENIAADGNGQSAGIGGAVALFNGSLSVEDSTFTGNMTRPPKAGRDLGSGGAIHVQGGSVAIAGSAFQANTAGTQGGAIWASDGVLAIASTTFEGNATGLPLLAETGGGAVYADGTTTISDATFQLNATGGRGGAILAFGPLAVTASTFDRNSAHGLVPLDREPIVGLGSGGAIAAPGGPPTVADSVFTQNFAAVGGGAIDATDPISISGSRFEDNGLRGIVTLDLGGGGAIRGSVVTVTGSVFNRNHARQFLRGQQMDLFAQPSGGAINAQVATVDASSFSFNEAAGAGGAIGANEVSVTATSLSHNISGGAGGAIAAGTASIQTTTLAFNVAGHAGGGTHVAGPATVVNSTFYGNTSDASQSSALYSGSSPRGGGAALSAQSGSVLNATFADNGGGGGTSAILGGLTLINTIVAGDPAGTNCAGGIVDGGHNIDSGTTCGFSAANASLSGVDPQLRGLAANGGPTRTVATARTSPAIDAGDTTQCPVRDQRGRARLNACDIGAYENRSV